MQVRTRLFILTMLFIMVMGVFLPQVSGFAQSSQAVFTYQYGYVTAESDQTYTLRFVDPDSSGQIGQPVLLPISIDEIIVQIDTSPNGQWMSFILGNKGSSGFVIRLFNIQTGELRNLAPLSIFRNIIWSPDSNYLAFTSTDVSDGGNSFSSYIYNLQDDTLNYLLGNDNIHYPYQLVWSVDGTQLAATSRLCSEDPCQGTIHVFDIPQYTIIASTNFNTYGDVLCDFAWSPDNRYLSFVFSCGDGAGPSLDNYISDVFTWDTTTGNITKTTSFTQEFAGIQTIDFAEIFNTLYDLEWFDSTNLLVGINAGRFTDGIGYDSSTIQLMTNVYHLDGSSAQVSNRLITEWVRNPVNNLIAFRAEEKVLYTDEFNMIQLRTEGIELQVGFLNDNSLQVLYTQPTGCDLSWSPDGIYFAYTTRGVNSNNCLDVVEGFNFLNQTNGQTSQFAGNIGGIIWSGWVAIIDNSPTETPTNLSTATNTPTNTSTPTNTAAPTSTDTPIPTMNETPTTTVTLTPTPAAAILFTSERDGNHEIYSMAVDGSNVVRLTASSGIDFYPTWFPDHSKIAFASTRNGNLDVYTMLADGSNVTQLTTSGGDDYGAQVSPDGTQMLFVSSRDGNLEIYRMNVDGTNQVRLTDNSVVESIPSWSPDGSKISFASFRDNNMELYTANPDGSNPTRLTNHAAQEYGPSWSPDGTRLAFVSTRDGNMEIYVMNVDGSNLTRLTTNSASDGFAVVGGTAYYGLAWSPDSSQLVFLSDRDGNVELYKMNADGTNPTRLTDASGVDSFPDW